MRENLIRWDFYLIQGMDECINSLGSATIISNLHTDSGYWNVVIENKVENKTTITSNYDLSRFSRMPFSLKNAPGTY